ncbi:MAG: CHAT domain-containing protein, partial [Anaerolineae bacterium]
MIYETFELRIQPGQNDTFEALVTRSLAGDARAGFVLPFTDAELAVFLWQTLGVSRHLGAADGAAGQAVDVQDFGTRLYRAVFNGDVAACLRRSLDEAKRRKIGLRIRLRIDDRLPALADLPWEYLFAPELGRFLALSADTPLLRYLEVPHAAALRPAPSPLVVLAVLSNPSGVTPLAVEEEWARLQAAVVSLGADQVRLERVAATWSALQARLRQSPAHVLHFIGHGYFDEEAQGGQGEGGLIFEDEAGQPVLTPAGRFKV